MNLEKLLNDTKIVNSLVLSQQSLNQWPVKKIKIDSLKKEMFISVYNYTYSAAVRVGGISYLSCVVIT